MRWGNIVRWVLGLALGVMVLVVMEWPSSRVRIVACSVGQGDAILVEKGFVQVLIDGGPSGERVLGCLQREMPFWDRRIELIVMTHSDYDHVNGLSDVIERYSVIRFVTGDGVRNTDTMLRIAESLRKWGVEVDGVKRGDDLVIRDRDGSEIVRLKVLWPNELNSDKLAVFSDDFSKYSRYHLDGGSDSVGGKQSNNYRSLVLELDWNGYRALFMGDADIQAEQGLIDGGIKGPFEYIKIGHHGSKTSSSLKFLGIVDPKLAVISVGRKNRYHHPSDEVLKRLEELGIAVRRTDKEGDVAVEF